MTGNIYLIALLALTLPVFIILFNLPNTSIQSYILFIYLAGALLSFLMSFASLRLAYAFDGANYMNDVLSILLYSVILMYMFYNFNHAIVSPTSGAFYSTLFGRITTTLALTGLVGLLYLTLSGDSGITEIRNMLYKNNPTLFRNLLLACIAMLAISIPIYIYNTRVSAEGFSSKPTVNPTTNPGDRIKLNPAYKTRRMRGSSILVMNNPTLMTTKDGNTYSSAPVLGSKTGYNSTTGIKKALSMGVRGLLVPT